jgi:hypothetical protein
MQGLLFNYFIVIFTLSKWISSFLFIILFTVPGAEANPPFQKLKKYSDPTYFKLTSIVNPQSVKPGSRFALYIKVELSAGWHIYSLYSKGVEKQPLATKIFLKSAMLIPHGHWEEPAPVIAWDGALEKVVQTHQQLVEFRRWYSVIKPLDSGLYKISGSIVFRACNNKVCNLPKKITYETKINVLSDKN